MPLSTGLRRTAGAVLLAIALAGPALAQGRNASVLDGWLMYQLLLAELELRNGDGATAYQRYLDSAKRTRDEQLFRRSVEIALQSRAGDQALAAVRAWRTAAPESLDAARTQVQLMVVLNRLPEAGESIRSLIQLTPAAERGALIAELPRAMQRASDRPRAAAVLTEVLEPHTRDKALAVPALVATARAWLAGAEYDRALVFTQQAQRADPSAPGPALVALELMPSKAEAEGVVTAHLANADAQGDPAVRLAYSRSLTSAQRYGDAIRELELVTRHHPDLAPPYLTLGALHVDLRQFAQGEAALKRFLTLAEASGAGNARPTDDDDDAPSRPEQAAIEAWLLLARSAEQRGDFAGAEAWLAKIEDPARALDVQSRRAAILARQGRVAEAREAVRRAPERRPDDARAKLVAEASMLRDAKHYIDAFSVLGQASERFPDDPDLLYEQAMMAEKLERFAVAEGLLRRVMHIKPDNAHAHNALGYSLADRNQRLPEARELIRRALELSPGDPFITDSLGWVEYRMGNLPEAERLLRQAYQARPDVEIAAHLGEVIWMQGRQDEARRIWREGHARDASNETLRETLARFKFNP
jgi:Flp pilus assembly protein TadD